MAASDMTKYDFEGHPIFTLDESEDQTKDSVIALVGHELFVASGRRIRRARWVDGRLDEDFEETELAHDIVSIVASIDEKVVALQGAKRLTLLTTSEASQRWTSSLRLIACGSGIYHEEETSSIVKVLWHPLDPTHSALAVLSSDGFLRLFDISKNVSEPDQVFDFFARSRPTRYGLRTDTRLASPGNREGVYQLSDLDGDREAVSFTLGSTTELRMDWSDLSAWCLTRGGDLYSICPVLPRQIHLPRLWLDTLTLYVEAKMAYLCDLNKRRRKAGVDTEDLGAFTAQYTMQSDFLKSMATTAKQDDHNQDCIIASLPSAPRPSRALARGPYLQQPTPAELDPNAESAADATDLLISSFQHVMVLGIVNGDGRVDLGYPEEVDPAWGTGQSDEGMPIIVFLYSIDLILQKYSDQARRNIRVSPLAASAYDFLINAEEALFHLNLLPVLQWLRQTSEDNHDDVDDSSVPRSLGAPKAEPSVITLLAEKSWDLASKKLCATIISGEVDGDFVLAMDSSSTYLVPLIFDNAEEEEATPIEVDAYHSLVIPDPAERLSGVFKILTPSPPLVLDNNISLSDLKALADLSQRFTEMVQPYQRHLLKSECKLAVHRSEMLRQLRSARTSQNAIADAESKLKSLKQDMYVITSKQNSSKKRLEAISSRIAKLKREVPLSKAESSWQEETQSVTKYVLEEGILDKQIETFRDELANAKVFAKFVDESAQQGESANEVEYRQMQDNAKTLVQMKKTLETLSSQLEELRNLTLHGS